MRRAARVLVFNHAGRLLLFRFVDPVSAAAFWITPGGGLHDGEGFADAAVRELLEETGIDAGGRLGPCVWQRTVDIVYGHKRFTQHERFFTLRLGAGEGLIDTAGMTDYETTDLAEHRWWPPEAIARSAERFAPCRLAGLLADVPRLERGGGPIDIGP
ncbi:MAG: NUDIX domain-containing protein [Planctomycetota bacterium]